VFEVPAPDSLRSGQRDRRAPKKSNENPDNDPFENDFSGNLKSENHEKDLDH
jgi:hypothetical protein